MKDKKITVVFFKNNSGVEPVREWLLGLSTADKKKIGSDIKSVEYYWPVGMPVVKNMGRKLWEVRTHLSDSRVSRIFFTIFRNKMILLHGFIKKDQKTPRKEIDLAMKRKKSRE